MAETAGTSTHGISMMLLGFFAKGWMDFKAELPLRTTPRGHRGSLLLFLGIIEVTKFYPVSGGVHMCSFAHDGIGTTAKEPTRPIFEKIQREMFYTWLFEHRKWM